MAALVAAAGFRSSTGALLEPLEAEFGWSRATTSGAVSLNLVIYGLTAPFAAALMERFGVRRVVAAALLLVALGSGLTLVMTSPWQLWLLWGFAVGVGTGSLALVFGAIVANRWFVRHRGVVVGVFSAASSTGQLVFLPAIAQLADGPGWRWAAGLVSVFALLLAPLVWLVMRDRPEDAGTTAYGAGGRAPGGAARPEHRVAGPGGDPDPAGEQPQPDVLVPVPVVLDLRLVDQRPDRHPLHPGRARPRHAGHDQRGPAGADRHLRHRRHGRQRLADRPGRQPLPALHLLLLPRAVAAGGAVAARRHRAPEPVRVHRVLRPRLGGHRAADRRAVPPALRDREVERGVRLGVRQPHGRGRHRGQLRRLGAPGERRLLRGLDDRGRPVPRRRGPVPAHPAAPRRARSTRRPTAQL